MSRIFYIVLCVAFCKCCKLTPLSYTTKVKLVTVLFRHGDRTTDAAAFYPRDPYINETYSPYGIGQLTSKGKRREYAIGQMLRNKYRNFLGENYVPGTVEAISTDMNRTKASLALVLAGLYPPRSSQLEWNKHLNWDPIPYNYLSFDKDMWMTTSLYFCPNYANLYREYMTSPAGQAITERDQELYQYLTEHTGLQISSPFHIMVINNCLETEEEWGLKLPPWTKQVYQKILKNRTVEALQTFVATTELKQLSGGLMLKRMIDNMRTKLKHNKKTSSNPTKIYLWSAHDLNIVYLSGALNQRINQIVPYGAYYIVELVEVQGVDCVAIYTIDYKTLEQVRVKIPGCDYCCPFEQFVNLVESNIPEGDNPCGSDLSYVERYKLRRNYYLGKISSQSIVDYYVKYVAEQDERISQTES